MNEITYPFPNCNGCTVEFWEWINNFITQWWAWDYLSMLGLKLTQVRKIPKRVNGSDHLMPGLRVWYELVTSLSLHGCPSITEAPVPLSRIVVRINANDIACEWRRFFPLKFGVRTGSTSMPDQNDLIRWLFANQYESDTNQTRIDTMQWDAIRCNTMATRCNTKQYGGGGESIRLRYEVTRTR